MAERAGEGLLGGVLGRGAVEAPDLEGAHEPAVVGLVDLDEVICRAGGGISWYRDILTQGTSDLRLRELQGNRDSQEVGRDGADGGIISFVLVATLVVGDDTPVLPLGTPEGTEPAPLEAPEPVELPELPVVAVGNPATALTGSTR
jgi:hypothetical protein